MATTQTKTATKASSPAKRPAPKSKVTPIERLRAENTAKVRELHDLLRRRIASALNSGYYLTAHLTLIQAWIESTWNNPLFAFLDHLPDDIENICIENHSFAANPELSRLYRTHSYVTLENGSVERQRVLRNRSYSGSVTSADVICMFHESLFQPDSEFKPTLGKYPTARHLLFTVLYLNNLKNNMAQEILSFQTDVPENPVFDVQAVGIHGLNDVVIDVAGFSSIVRGHFRRPLRISNQTGNICINYLTFSVVGTSPERYLPILIDDLIAGERAIAKRISKDFDESDIEDRLNEEEQEMMNVDENRIVITTCLIEGIHFNRHRFDELKPFIREFDTTFADALAEVKATSSLPLFHFRNELDSWLTSFVFSGLSVHSKPYVIECGRMRLAPHAVCALYSMSQEASKYVLSEEEIAERALQYTVWEMEKELDAVRSSVRDLNQKLMEHQESELRLRTKIKSCRAYNAECLASLRAGVESMDIFEKIEMLPNFSLALQTMPIFATPTLDLSDDNYSDSERDEEDDGRRYVGVYQIVISPILKGLAVRNIAAPIVVTSSLVPFTLFHPHSSIDEGETHVCLGGYVNLIKANPNRESDDLIDGVKTRLLAVLQFLQTYRRDDSYVDLTFDALTSHQCKNTGITDWQEFSSVGIKELLLPTNILDVPRSDKYIGEKLNDYRSDSARRSKTRDKIGYMNLDIFLARSQK